MFKKISITILSLTCLFITAKVIFAQTATDSGSVNEIRQAVKEKVNQKLEQVARRPVGVVGTIQDLTNNIMAISITDQKINFSTDSTTKYERVPGKRAIERSDLAIGDSVLVKGIHDTSQNTFEAQTVQVIPEPQVPERTYKLGTISQVNRTSVTLTDGDQQWTINFDQSTDIFNRADSSALKTIKSTELKAEQIIAVVGTPDAKKKQTLKSLVILILKAAPAPSPTTATN